MSVIAIDTASRDRAWVVRAGVDGAVEAGLDVPGGALDRRLPGVLGRLLTADVSAIVVLMGPGSYTGVRAGMAAALGVAEARGLPLHGMGSLDALALAAGTASGEVVRAVADAGRGGVYTASFAGEGALMVQLTPVTRMAAGDIDTSARVVASSPVSGLAPELLEPVRVLARAVPAALATEPLTAAGLAAVHAPSVRA